MTKQKPQSACQETDAEFSDELIGQLARRLPQLWARSDDLEGAQRGLSQTGERYHALEREFAAVQSEILAVEDLILASRCGAIETAAIQLMLAAAAIDSVALSLECESAGKRCRQALRAIRGVLPVVARAADLDLQSIGAERYAPPRIDPYPCNELPAAAVAGG